MRLFFGLFTKIRGSIHQKVEYNEPGLYLYVLFPIAFAFIATFGVSRLISHLAPQFYVPVAPGVRVHHYAYGFFVLAASGYLALVFTEARERFLIGLLHGFGLGLAFDEFGMWLRLKDDDIARWSYDGFTIIGGVILLILSAKPGMRALKFLWPFGNGKNGKNGKPKPTLQS